MKAKTLSRPASGKGRSASSQLLQLSPLLNSAENCPQEHRQSSRTDGEAPPKTLTKCNSSFDEVKERQEQTEKRLENIAETLRAQHEKNTELQEMIQKLSQEIAACRENLKEKEQQIEDLIEKHNEDILEIRMSLETKELEFQKY